MSYKKGEAVLCFPLFYGPLRYFPAQRVGRERENGVSSPLVIRRIYLVFTINPADSDPVWHGYKGNSPTNFYFCPTADT